MGKRLSDATRQALSDPRHPAYDPERLTQLEAAERARDLRIGAGDGVLQELDDRIVTLEIVLADVITIVADNTESPFVMAEKLRELLLPTDAIADELAAREADRAEQDAPFPGGPYDIDRTEG